MAEAVFRHERDNPSRVALQRFIGGTWIDVTSAEFAGEVRAVAKGLIAAGVRAGDRVSIFSDTRYDWTLADYAIMAVGAATVPIYPSSGAEQVEWILSDSGAVAVFCAERSQAEVVASVRASLPQLANVWVFDDGAIATVVELGREIPDGAVEERMAALSPDSLATVIYTSGTTGRPKGCELTHGNLLCECRTVVKSAPEVFHVGAKTLLFLPVAHILGKVMQCGSIEAGVVVGHYSDMTRLTQILPTFGPDFILAVPRVFERIYNAAGAGAHESRVKGAIFDFAVRQAIDYSTALDAPNGPGAALKARHAVADRLVYSKLRAKLGGELKWAMCGGAPLGARLGHFFRGSGITILEGYGLTETTAAVTFNRPDQIKVGTVGRPIPGISIGIADDGEVLVKGPVVFAGYWHNAQATAAAFDADGWFLTGDIGMLDEDGFLSITGRKKELLVTAGGKNVAPAVLEDRINAHPLVSLSMVVGDAKPFIACVVTIDPDALETWKAHHGKPTGATVADLADDPDLRAAVQEAIDGANAAVSRAESIRKFTILPADFTEAAGEVTPTLKLKRKVVSTNYAAQIEGLYQ
jgi:long-chain acyl-CoA synthetase